MAWYPAWYITWQRFRYWREQIGFESAYSKLKTECRHGENIDAIGNFIVKHGVKTEIV